MKRRTSLTRFELVEDVAPVDPPGRVGVRVVGAGIRIRDEAPAALLGFQMQTTQEGFLTLT